MRAIMSCTASKSLPVAALLLAAAAFAVPGSAGTGGRQLAVAWNNEPGEAGSVAPMRARPPFAFNADALASDRGAVLHPAHGKLFVLNPGSATVRIVNPRTWRLLRTLPLGAGGRPEDIAVTDPRTLYFTREGSRHLMRLDLRSGAVTRAADFQAFADEDGSVYLGTMILHRNRLFIQVRRPNALGPEHGSPHGYLAVVNPGTGRLLDIDRSSPGIQAIPLTGTMPRLRMQVVPQTQRLYISATGRFHDAGGIEAINLRTLRSEGLVIREEDGEVGADLGPFVFTAPDRGFLVYSTDLTLSSHLLPFTLADGVPPGPELHVSVDYFVPTLVHDPRANLLFLPDGVYRRQGIFVFDARTGSRLTEEPIATNGAPVDLVLIR